MEGSGTRKNPMSRIFEVEVVHRLYVSAESAEQAETWADAHANIWNSDPPESIVASAVTVKQGKALPEEVLGSLPWAAGGVADEEADKPVRWWVGRIDEQPRQPPKG